MKTLSRVQRVTSKGQITLPVSWRTAVQSDQVLVEQKGEVIEISPVHLSRRQNEKGWYTVFDAIQDNKGKGIKAEDLLKILKKIDG